jgi:uracil-DNA glycosylase
MIDPKIEPGWKAFLLDEFQKDYMRELKSFLENELNTQTVYPPPQLIFSAFDHCPLERLRLVIIGQDPYHGPGQANGLCFSVNPGTTHPPSLRNIFKELESDLNIAYPKSGDLRSWAEQGVFLLNATLTVRARQAGSHQGKGWERFTDTVIQRISDEKEGLIFLLWGGFARKKKQLIDTDKHHILEAPHPSPLSAYHGFFGCRHFSQANALLKHAGKEQIDWSLV